MKKHEKGFHYKFKIEKGEKTLVVCAWCGWKEKDEEKIFFEKKKFEKENGGASHGICEECNKKHK